MTDPAEVGLRGPGSGVAVALREGAVFEPGAGIRRLTSQPIGHNHAARYLRVKTGVVQEASEPCMLNNEEEAFERNASMRGERDRVLLPIEIWPNMASPPGRLIRLLDIGRFALDTQAAEVGAPMQTFPQRRGV